jgi:hypothetical protein
VTTTIRGVAIVKVTQRICDRCGSPEGVSRYQINMLDVPRRLTADLCDVHKVPIEELAEAIPADGRKKRSRGQPVVSEETVKAQRRTAKKGTPRR